MASAAEQLARNINFGAFNKATELKKRIWFTLGALIVYRLGTFIPLPGIDPTALDLGAYGTPVDVPVRRQQNEFGINYWFTPRLVIKFAYQINDEPGFHLHDNQFITEMAWGW